MIPGHTLHRLARRICCAQSLERIVEPAIADLQKEHLAARGSHMSRRSLVLLRGYIGILKVMAVCALAVSVASRDERRALIRTYASCVVAVLAVTVLLLLPPLALPANGISVFSHLVLLVPQAVPLAIPIGLTFGAAFGLYDRKISKNTVKGVLLLAFAASLVAFVTMEWVRPAVYPFYSEAVARAAGGTAHLIKEPSDMTLSELSRETTAVMRHGDSSGARRYAWAFHLRFALSSAALFLVGVFFATSPGGAVSRGALALIACVVYWALLYTGEALVVHAMAPPFAGAWLPNVAFGAAALAIASRSSHVRHSIPCR